MKKKKLYLFLAIEAIIIALIVVVTRNSYDNTASLVSFPFGLIGDGAVGELHARTETQVEIIA